MGNNLDCSNKNHKFKFTLWNLLWEIPLPSCSSSPKKQIPTSFIRFHIDAFFNFLTHPCLERPKTTVWIHCSALESGLWWPGAPNPPSTTLGCVDPTLPVHLLSCALNLLLLWGKHPSCREGMGRAEGGERLWLTISWGSWQKWIKRVLGCDWGRLFPTASTHVCQSPRVPCATSQAARGSLPPANSGGSYLRAFVAEQRSGWGSIPKAKSHSNVRSKPAGSALPGHWRGTKEPLWDSCEDESEFVEIVCVYT